MDKFKIINTAQHRFQERDSTTLALATIYDKLLLNFNDNKFTCSVFLDLSKAFDTVNHDILIKEIQHYGFRGKFLNILIEYNSQKLLICHLILLQSSVEYHKVQYLDPCYSYYIIIISQMHLI